MFTYFISICYKHVLNKTSILNFTLCNGKRFRFFLKQNYKYKVISIVVVILLSIPLKTILQLKFDKSLYISIEKQKKMLPLGI